jgi:hypothetical protein
MPKARKLEVVDGGTAKQPAGPRPWEKPVDGRACTTEESEACWKVVQSVLAGWMTVVQGHDEIHRILGTTPDDDAPF